MDTGRNVHCGRILFLIDHYLEEIRLLRENNVSAQDMLLKYVGMGKEQKSPLHKKLYADVEGEVSALVQELSENSATDLPDGSKAKQNAAAETATASANAAAAEDAVRILLGVEPYVRDIPEDSIRLMMAAIEGLAEPLIGYLSAETCEAIGAEYQARYKPQQMMPKQKAVYTALKKSYDKKEGILRNLFRKGGK